MRDLLLASILLGSLPFVLRHAFVGVLLWTWISIMNPHKLAWSYMFDAPVAALVAGVTIISLVTTRDRVQWVLPVPLFFASALLIWTCITTVFAFFPADSLFDLKRFFKILLMVLVTAAVLYKREHIRWFIWVCVLSLGFYGVKGGLYTIATGGSGRVWGPPGGFIEGNNEIALALIVTIPLMNFLRMTSPYPWVRRFLVAMMLLSAVAATGSQSRGAFLAIAAMGFFLWWRAPRKLPGAIAGVCVAVSILAFMPQSWHHRMETISTYQSDGSAMGRIHAWQTAHNVANHRVTGAGFGMYNPLVFYLYAPHNSDSQFDPGIVRAAHSIYFQILGEHGYVGLFLFLMTWFSAWRVAGQLRRGTRGDAETAWLYYLGSMSQVALVGYAVGGAFLSLAYFDLPYNVVVMLVLAKRWHSERASGQVEASESVTSGGLLNIPIAGRVRRWVATA